MNTKIRCLACEREIGFNEVLTISPSGDGALCEACGALVDSVYTQAVGAIPLTKEDADALAAKWASGMVAPEDFDPRISEWKTERAVREMVKEGELHQKQVTDELERRKKAGIFGHETPAFVDKHPLKGYDREKANARKRALESAPAQEIEGDG